MGKIKDLKGSYTLEDILDCDDCGMKYWDKVLEAIISDNRFDKDFKEFCSSFLDLWKNTKYRVMLGTITKGIAAYLRNIDTIKSNKHRMDSLERLDDLEG